MARSSPKRPVNALLKDPVPFTTEGEAVEGLASPQEELTESILLTLPLECLTNVLLRHAEDSTDLFDRQKAIRRFAQVCKLFAEVASTVDLDVLVCNGIVKVREEVHKLREDPERASRIHIVAIKTLSNGAKAGLKGDESTAKSLPEKPERIRDCMALLVLLKNVRRIDLRVNGKRGSLETKHLMLPLPALPCLETLESLSIDFPRAWDANEDTGFLEPRKEWVDWTGLLPRLSALRVLRIKTLSLKRQEVDGDDVPPMPSCRLAHLEADDINNSFARWLNGSHDMTIKLDDGCLGSKDQPIFDCSSVTDLTVGRIDVNGAARVSLPNVITLRANLSHEFRAGSTSAAFFELMPVLQQLYLPIAPSRAYSRTRLNTRAAKSHAALIEFIVAREQPVAYLEVVSENWDTPRRVELETACEAKGVELVWRSLYK